MLSQFCRSKHKEQVMAEQRESTCAVTLPFSCRHRVHVQPPHTSRGLRGTSGHLGAVRALGFTGSVGAWYERAQCLETRITVYPCLPLQTQTPLLQAPLIIPPGWIPRRRLPAGSRRFPAGCKPNCYTQRLDSRLISSSTVTAPVIYSFKTRQI